MSTGHVDGIVEMDETFVDNRITTYKGRDQFLDNLIPYT